MKKSLKIFLTLCFASIGAVIALIALPCFFMVKQYEIMHFTGKNEW